MHVVAAFQFSTESFEEATCHVSPLYKHLSNLQDPLQI